MPKDVLEGFEYYGDEQTSSPEVLSVRSINSDPPDKWAERLENAVKNNCIAELKAILDAGVNPNGPNIPGCRKTPLNIAISSKNRESVKLLLEYGADANPNFFNWYDIVRANFFDPETFRLLMAHGADVNARDDRGETVLFYCTNEKKYPAVLDCVKVLVEAGADLKAVNNNKETIINALHDRTSHGRFYPSQCPEVIKYLVSKGAPGRLDAVSTIFRVSMVFVLILVLALLFWILVKIFIEVELLNFVKKMFTAPLKKMSYLIILFLIFQIGILIFFLSIALIGKAYLAYFIILLFFFVLCDYTTLTFLKSLTDGTKASPLISYAFKNVGVVFMIIILGNILFSSPGVGSAEDRVLSVFAYFYAAFYLIVTFFISLIVGIFLRLINFLDLPERDTDEHTPPDEGIENVGENQSEKIQNDANEKDLQKDDEIREIRISDLLFPKRKK
ncbi:MAG: hypothetical protein PHW04_16850 [Candidatus Wallbacteria bacterium]|nr:hypothetical protein [Candidatus Wallbacteria bacterium]